jgi:hypothetical protein
MCRSKTMRIGIGIAVGGKLLLGFAVSSVLAVALYQPAALAAEHAYERLDPNAYESFVANWTPDDWPLCAVIRTQADWNLVLKPAPTMGQTKPFSPPPEFWKFKAVLLVAYVVDAGDTADIFHIDRLTGGKGAWQLDYRFTPPPAASSKVKSYLAVAVTKPLPPIVRFKEGSRLICTMRTQAMIPITPSPSQ